MIVTRIIGVETEYAIAPLPDSSSGWGESGTADLLDRLVETGAHGARASLPAVRCSMGREGFFLSNGARLYRDGPHVEYATPETTNPADLVCCVLAGERIVSGALQRLCGRGVFSPATRLYKTSQGYGRSPAGFGCHENYSYRNHSDAFLRALLPFVASRIIYTGSGGYAARKPIRFTLSPRLYFLSDRSCGGDGYYMVNGRDEPLSDNGTRRLHLIAGESLCSHLGMYLKVGATGLVVAMADAGVMPPDRLIPKEMTAAARRVAADPACSIAVADREDRETLRAVDIQRWYLREATRRIDEPWMPDWAPEVIGCWGDILDRLEAGAPQSVATRLDWAAKWCLHETRCRDAGYDPQDILSWDRDITSIARCVQVAPYTIDNLNAKQMVDDPRVIENVIERWPLFEGGSKKWERLEDVLNLRAQLHEIDTRFSEIGPDGLFNQLDAAGAMDHTIPQVAEQRVRDAMAEPPRDTRALCRSELIERLATRKRPHRYQANWHYIRYDGRRGELQMPDPLDRKIRWRLAPRPAKRARGEALDFPTLNEEIERVVRAYQTAHYDRAYTLSHGLLAECERRAAEDRRLPVRLYPWERAMRYASWTAARLGRSHPEQMLRDMYERSMHGYMSVIDHLFIYRQMTYAPLPQMEVWVERSREYSGRQLDCPSDIAEPLGFWYLFRGDYGEALACLEPIADLGERLRGSRVRENLFNCYLRMGDRDAAQRMLADMRHHARGLSGLLADHVWPAEVRLTRDPDRRARLLRQAYRVHRRRGNRLGMIRVNLMRARLCDDSAATEGIHRQILRDVQHTTSVGRCPLYQRIMREWARWCGDDAPDEHGDTWWGL